MPARLRRGTRRCALYKALTLSALRAQRRLDAVGFVWEKPSQTEAWDAFYAQLLVPAPKAPAPAPKAPHPLPRACFAPCTCVQLHAPSSGD